MSNETPVFHHDARSLPHDGVNPLAGAGEVEPAPGGRNVIVAGRRAAPLVANSGGALARSDDLSDSYGEVRTQLLGRWGPA
ncbi:hypothetical protein EVC45_32260 [Paraburkholderia sp. UYCP14C]|uniref:hypothetical protein n=1 Tax=Paraburkholderia sp. UYCP14C TaxID=2511130 RepID=UPI00102099DB|nr:hypothetical protein [Paraburkholderia sp. UYCP14C]RZF25688.1 hypothetical protein EVC45_32260 [Paraburkholderia sp. UYCP14C]